METPVTTERELREVLGEPGDVAAGKVRTALHDLDRRWIAASPLVLVATAGADGSCDVSPKGDPAGAVVVLSDTTLVLAERPGNRRADGFVNVLANPHAGLMFVVPGRTDLLRVNGSARLVRDAPWFDDLVVRGHRPLLALVLDVEEVFFHCAKALMRSRLWEPDSWSPDAVASRATISQALERRDDSLADVERHYGPAYADGLYRA